MITLSTASLSGLADLPLCLFAFEDAGIAGARSLSPAARKGVLEAAKAEPFKSAVGECAGISYSDKGILRRYVVVGLGKKKDYTPETLRRAAGGLYHFAKNRYPVIAVLPDGDLQAAAEGLQLASYRFDEYRKPEETKLKEAKLALQSGLEKKPAEKALARAALASEAVALTRDLVNRGPSDKTPQSLAALAESLAGVKVKVILKDEAAELGMGSYLAVARGSAVDPVFLHLVYKPKGAKKRVGLVGKGITFDSGGLSLKPPASMETMKMDMAGAASVLGVFKVLARLAPKVEVHGFCAITYNMPGPDAIKPGDVVKAMNGKTIEILNTDAEGRLVLADALVYAGKQELDGVIDLATLTGAVIIALGSKVTGAMTNNKPLLRQLTASAGRAQEELCELPLPRDYKEGIKSSIADLQNIGKARGEAGSIIGGLFLEEFVDGKPWVHLDIAGTAWNNHGTAYCPEGGTGSIVRTLLDYLASL